MSLENLYIERTSAGPYVMFDAEDESMRILGNSYMENVSAFYAPLIEWAKEYVERGPKYTYVYIHLEHTNSSSMKHLFELFKIFYECSNVVFIWVYEKNDDDMEDIGLAMKDVFGSSWNMTHA